MKKLIVGIIISFVLFTLNFLLFGQLIVGTESGHVWKLHIPSPTFYFIMIPLIPISYIFEASLISKKIKATTHQNTVYWLFVIVFNPALLYIIGFLQLYLFDR